MINVEPFLGFTSQSGEIYEALQSYTDRASKLRGQPDIPLLVAINESQKHPDRPFIVVDGSSGVGKTQSAFIYDGPSIYLLIGYPGGSPQAIYKTVEDFSDDFRQLISADLTDPNLTPVDKLDVSQRVISRSSVKRISGTLCRALAHFDVI